MSTAPNSILASSSTLQALYPGRVEILTTKVLSRWARNIQKTLPALKMDHGRSTDDAAPTGLTAFMVQLDMTDVTARMLGESRIHLALIDIVQNKGKWNPEVVSQAEATLLGWHELFGNLKLLTKDVWSGSSRMNGVHGEVGRNSGRYTPGAVGTKDTWVWKRHARESNPLRSGDLGFSVGDWWIDSAAACRDGIILALDGITAGTQQAYAIVMNDEEEGESAKKDHLRYRVPQADPRGTKSLRNMITRDPVRILRTTKSKSGLKPVIGVCYEGLYIIIGWSVNLVKNQMGEGERQYTLIMSRMNSQPDIQIALKQKRAEERDDWDAY